MRESQSPSGSNSKLILEIDVTGYIQWMVIRYNRHDSPQNRAFAGIFISHDKVLLNIGDQLDCSP